MMSEAAAEEVSVLSAIYCGQGEFQLLQQSEKDGFLVQINTMTGGERALNLSLLFHLHPQYPSCPPDISISSTAISRTQCHSIRQKLLDQAATLSPEPMVHQLVEWIQQQDVEGTKDRGAVEEVKDRDKEERWTAVLSLDHIRSRSRYAGLLEGWSQQLHLTGRLLLGRIILVILQGARADIKEFFRLLKTVKVDVDSSGRKCKERMMKVLIEAPSPSSCEEGFHSFVVVDYQSSAELSEVFQGLHISELYQQILPSLRTLGRGRGEPQNSGSSTTT